MLQMDFPGVRFYVENKKIFPLPSGIKQQNMPMSYELQGVSLTGQSMETQCFVDVKDDKFNDSLQKDKNKDFALLKDKQFCAKRETCGHFGSFPVISFSHLVGGFVGSKSQIRSVNREACQIWDVIFRQLAETACQTPSMQSQYYNFGKTFSQNLLNSICLEGRSALDGIASYLISKSCEFLQEQEMIHSMTVSEFKGKDVTLESSKAQYCKEATNCSCEPHLVDSPHHFTATESVLDLESSVVNIPKQSYAEVAKSVISKSENTNSNQTNRSSGRIRISTRLAKEIKGKSKVVTLSDPSKLDGTRGSEDTVKNSVNRLKKMDKSCQYKERRTSGTSRTDLQTTKTIFYNNFPKFCSSQHPKRVTQKIKFSYVPSRVEMGNWRERSKNCESIWQHTPQNFKGRGQYKPINMVYPAFSGKKNSCGSKARDNTNHENFLKHQRSDESSNKDTIGVLGVSQFGKRFKQLPKVFRTKARETQDKKRDCDRKATQPFGLHTNMANTCRNWRCKHKGVFCEAFHCDNYASAGNNIGKTVPLTSCTPEPYINGSSSTVCSNDDSLRVENLQNPFQGKEQIVPLPIAPDVTSSIECISVSSSCEDILDISENRKRFLSECSVDSDDSFIVFFESECVQEASPEDCESRQLFQYPSIEVDISDGWSDEDDDSCSGDSDNASDNQDEVDFVFFSPPQSVPALSSDCSDKLVSPLPDRLKDINETWRKDNASVPGDEKSSTKVHFPTCQKLVTVHPMVKWEFAYRAARCGPWEEMARDRARFKARVGRLEPILSPVLTPEHRQKARLRMTSSAIS